MIPANVDLPSTTTSAGRVGVYVTGTFTAVVVPTMIAFPLLTVTPLKTSSGAAACASGADGEFSHAWAW